jgi:hypothetical protein
MTVKIKENKKDKKTIGQRRQIERRNTPFPRTQKEKKESRPSTRRLDRCVNSST